MNSACSSLVKRVKQAASSVGCDRAGFPDWGLRGSVLAPVVEQCPIVYECKVVHSNDILPPRLAEEIRASAYAGGDFHRVYWGEILAARADPKAAELLAE